ncbi:hypothetical protein KJ688_05760 [bacterium]|nr:hypothetical protein [bacterium]
MPVRRIRQLPEETDHPDCTPPKAWGMEGSLQKNRPCLPCVTEVKTEVKTEAKMVAEGEALKTDHISSYVKN